MKSFLVFVALLSLSFALKCPFKHADLPSSSQSILDCDEVGKNVSHISDPNAEKYCLTVVYDDNRTVQTCGVVFWSGEGFTERIYRCTENGETDCELNGLTFKRYCCDTDECNKNMAGA